MATWKHLLFAMIAGIVIGTCLLGTEVVIKPAAASTQPPPPRPLPPFADSLDSMVKVEFANGGHCTGVILAPHTFATAYHCVERGFSAIMRVDGVVMLGEVVANDGHDHILIRTNKPLSGTSARVAPFPPPGSQVHTWGNPGSLESVLRMGTVSGVWQSASGKYFHVIDMNNWHGDSGGPIFDAEGRLVALHYGYYVSVNGPAQFRMTIVEPLAFTPQQYWGMQ